LLAMWAVVPNTAARLNILGMTDLPIRSWKIISADDTALVRS